MDSMTQIHPVTTLPWGAAGFVVVDRFLYALVDGRAEVLFAHRIVAWSA
jgi:hypothetical protein